MRKVARDAFKIIILPQFLAIDLPLVQTGCDRTREIAILLQFLAIEPHFVQKVARDAFKIIILRQFLAIEPHFMRKGCDRTSANRDFTSVFDDRTSFRAKGLRGTLSKSQFYRSFWRSNLISCERDARDKCKSQFYPSFWRSNIVSCDRVAFRAVSLALPRALREK